MNVNPGYESLAGVLQRALDQAQTGKGAERHADSKPFYAQPMQQLMQLYGVGFATGQAAKKSQEAMRLPAGRDVAELLGAINYLAGAVLFLELSRDEVPEPVNDNRPGCGLIGGCSDEIACFIQGRCKGVGAQVKGRRVCSQPQAHPARCGCEND